MLFETEIALRFFNRKSSSAKISSPVLWISVAGIVLSVAVMIVSVGIVTGFKNEITNKVAGFGAHINITSFNSNNSLEESPIDRNQPFINELKKTEGIRHVQVFATKAGIIKTKTDLQGIVIKGIDKDFDRSFFSDKIKEGLFPAIDDSAKSNTILISKKIALLLRLKLNDPLVVYFIGDRPRARKFIISGIYETGLEEFDNAWLFADIKNIQQLNGWRPDEVGGFEITVNDFRKAGRINEKVSSITGYKFKSETIVETYPQIFNWLDMQDVNVLIILVLMALVSGINMISTLLIIILENTLTIGLLKSMGATNLSIRKIFLLIAAYITFIGIAGGNLLGISLCLLQQKFHFIKLPLESYYMSYVPVHISGISILYISISTLVICTAMLLIPSMIVSRIQAARVLRMD